ncbi:unnamed protein product [Didymodactylos carnosus]|uniref:FAD-binding PCMH-type domain-containing protein n=1 Tax=Didymodactylos carnosus TaxID=1234261 RepID=A0A8S2DXF9_9BILA|nr:unnamed protein product [Didymodactylos carnosus]CAF3794316.1 unnamed protein product [Didymodactylos carnosus]
MRNGVLKSHNTIRNEFKFTNMRSRINRTEHSHSTNINKTAKRSLTLIVTTISATAAATLLLHQKSHLAAEVDGAATAIKSANEVADSTQVSSTLPSEACKELSSLLGSRFTMDKDDCSAHANDSSSYHSGPLPAAVAYPVSTEEVSKIAQIASKYKFILVPYGSGTSLEGHTSAPNNGSLTVDMSHMQRILKIHAEDMQVTVEPGVSYHHLNDELKSTGLYFPVDPGPGASIGGMVGTSCSGTNAVRYGTMKFNVVNVTVVLADGTIIKTAQRARKSSAGYDLTRLFIGSEGTLGIITEVTLKLHNIPEQTAVAICQFDSIKSAAAAKKEGTAQNVSSRFIIRVYTKLDDELLNDLTKDVENYLIAGSIPEKEDQTTDFYYSCKMIEDCQQKLIDTLKSYYNGNAENMKTINEFEQSYLPSKAIWWYTRDTFFYCLLNKGLRQHDTEMIFLFGFYIRDIYVQLKEEYKN